MTLIKTAPKVRLLLPRALVAGGVAEFLVELDCPKPVPVDAVSLSLFGDVVWFTTSQHGRHRHSSRFLAHHAPLLATETELEVGTYRLRTKVGLGEDLPGSWEGDRVAIEYGVKIHVDIPWWPDKRVEFVVRVARGEAEHSRATTPPADPGPVVFVSHAGGPPTKGPYIELSLGQRSIRPGQPMRLSAALGNVERNRYRKLHIAVIAQEVIPTGLGGEQVFDHAVGSWTVDIQDHRGELQPIPFSLDVPGNLVPAFEIHGCGLRWVLQAHADVAWGIDPKLRMPIHVQPRELGDDAEIAAPLAVGSDRLRLIWSAVARATGLELVEDRLRGALGDIAIEVHRGQDDEGGARVVGLLELPDLGVGLHPRHERRTLLGGVEARLDTRDPEQTKIIDEQVGGQLGEQPDGQIYELLDADDHRLLVAWDGAGLELAPLQRFVTWLVDLAKRVADLPAQLPPPAVMSEYASAWERAAKSLSGQLRPSDLRVEIVRDELILHLACDYDDEGQLRATRLELDPKLTIPTRHHLIWTGDTVLPEHELPLADLATAPEWADSKRVAIHVEAKRVRVLLPAPLPDPTLERVRVEALFRLGRQLRGVQGPYR